MKKFCFWAALACAVLPGAFAQPTFYNGTNATGELVLTRTVNALQVASAPAVAQASGFTVMAQALGFEAPALNQSFAPSVPGDIPRFLPRRTAPSLPSFKPFGAVTGEAVRPARFLTAAAGGESALSIQAADAAPQSLTVVPGGATLGFNGMTHADQKLASNGNQFSVEPANPSIATGNGYILQGVNNAVQVYSSSGTPLLPKVLSSNQLFGVAPAIDYSTNIEGVFPTDMRVFYDAAINRFFVLQRAQDNDIFGNLLSTSKYYLAVSQTGDPTGTYNIYVMDTTNASFPGCPCLADYPQIGADQYGIYISANQYQSLFDSYVGAGILAIAKGQLESGAQRPVAFKFNVRFTVGDEFTIQPAVTPPGGSYFLANAGVEYFVSTNKTSGNAVALWALSNTSSLLTSPNLLLTKITVPTLNYSLPPVATQPEGFRPYGSSLIPPGRLPFIETGDSRALSLVYVAGRLYFVIPSGVTDAAGKRVAGAAYIVLSPTVRKGTLAGTVVQQGYIMVSDHHLLFPSMAVDAQGRGVIVATLTGPSWYPSTAFAPFMTFSTPSTLRVAAAGLLPQDGFTGYDGTPARWGDYSGAVVASDGSFWIVSEYIGNLPRTTFANWHTFIAQYRP